MEEKVKDQIILFKSGKFYYVYKNDAYIFKMLFDYKILSDDKIGFPETSYNKVINKLEDEKISYQVIFKDRNPIIKSFDNRNRYDVCLRKALKYIDVDVRINKIMEKINSMNLEELENILEKLEDVFI